MNCLVLPSFSPIHLQTASVFEFNKFSALKFFILKNIKLNYLGYEKLKKGENEITLSSLLNKTTFLIFISEDIFLSPKENYLLSILSYT